MVWNQPGDPSHDCSKPMVLYHSMIRSLFGTVNGMKVYKTSRRDTARCVGVPMDTRAMTGMTGPDSLVQVTFLSKHDIQPLQLLVVPALADYPIQPAVIKGKAVPQQDPEKACELYRLAEGLTRSDRRDSAFELLPEQSAELSCLGIVLEHATRSWVFVLGPN